jgi:hypothetical protein
MEITFDLSYPHNYEVDIVDNIPSGSDSIRHVFFPGATETGGKDGVTLRITPLARKPWIGTFAYGYSSQKALTAVFSCPDEHILCVLAAGRGYTVTAKDPIQWSELSPFPIISAFPILSSRIIVFVDFTTISAYRNNELIWVTDQLSWDGIMIKEITSEQIRGTGWDSPAQKEVDFIVDIKTGVHKGGSSPNHYRQL